MKVFGTALVLAAELAYATLHTSYLEHDWQVQFDDADCSLEINKIVKGQGLSHVTVFKTDKNLISIGRGDIDDYQVMTMGNIKRFPKRQS